jgi:coproporphyrinogen dehydrogenase HemZ
LNKICVLCEDPEYRKFLSELLTIFYLVTNIEFVQNPEQPTDADFLQVYKTNGLTEVVYTRDGEVKTYSFNDQDIVKNRTKTVKRILFRFLNEIWQSELPWGFLTGVRPVKMAVNMLLQGFTPEEAQKSLENDFLIAPEKAKLLTDLANKELTLTGRVPTVTDTVSLYISIPFCPDRCAYCSFTSYVYSKNENMVSEYVDCLVKELEYIKEVVKGKGQGIQTVYIGGGTPGVLPPMLTDKLLGAVDDLCTDETIEITFEAGRPEVFNDEKQKIVKNHRVTRICINPQSMDDRILKNIGRNHTVEDILRCFDLAVKNGFDNINTDIIVGLPGETVESFSKNLEALLDLNPQSVTVHTLAMKKKAGLIQNHNAQDIVNNKDVDEMIRMTERKLFNQGFEPYYLYRQKMTVGNRENVGYCKKGFECIYNIQMIGERQTIYGAGAGATGRFVSEDLLITRKTNKKLVDQYIKDIRDGNFGYG